MLVGGRIRCCLLTATPTQPRYYPAMAARRPVSPLGEDKHGIAAGQGAGYLGEPPGKIVGCVSLAEGRKQDGSRLTTTSNPGSHRKLSFSTTQGRR